MARKLGLENTASYVVPEQAPDWSSGRYLNYAGRTVKYQDIVNMTNMDVARNSTMVGLSRLGPALMAVPHPATKMIGGFATVAGMAYDGLKLFSRLHSEKDNNAFWAEYNEALKEVGSQGPVQRAVTDFAIGANFVSGQSLPAELAPIGGVPAVLGSFANLAAVGVFGTASFIGGSAISMGMNDAHTRIGMGEELGSAVRSGFSRGIAAGATGAVFLGVMPYITRYLGGKMVDNEIALGFMSTPMRKQVVTRGVAATAGAIDFAGWGVSDYYTNNAMRSYLGLKPTEEELSPVAIAGMMAMGGFFNGALKSKTLEYLLEKAAGKKSAIQTVKETIGNRYFQDVTTPERQQELLNIQAGRDLPMGGKQVRGTLIEGPLSKVQERLLEAESGVRPFGKSVEQIIMERSGVPKKLTTPEQVEKLGGAEAVLRNTLSDDLAVARALEEIATANRLVSQAKEYELSSQAFATERTGASKVTDTFIPDADGVAKKVRIVDKAGSEHYFTIDRTGKTSAIYRKRGVGEHARYDTLEWKETDGSYRVINSEIGKENRGKGIGTELYKTIVDEALSKGKIFESDNSVSSEAMRVYKALEKRGYKVEYAKETEESPAYESVIRNGFREEGSVQVQSSGSVVKIISGPANNVPTHISNTVKIGGSAIVSGLIYTNLGGGEWDIAETQWLTPPQSQKVAELARNEYRISRNRQDALNKAMNSLSDTYALNPDNYKMVYDRFMKLTGGYA